MYCPDLAKYNSNHQIESPSYTPDVFAGCNLFSLQLTHVAAYENPIQAERDGATYLGCGAVFSTQTKHDATFLPHDVLCDIRQAVSIPVVAIGGINAQNIPKLYDTGIDGVAVVSAVFGQPNVEAAAQTMRELTAPFQQKEQGR